MRRTYLYINSLLALLYPIDKKNKMNIKEYLTIEECLALNIIELSVKQVKRRIRSILNDIGDTRVMYKLKNGIKTIFLESEYAKTLYRIRKKKTYRKNDEIKFIQTEITIYFNETFDSNTLHAWMTYFDDELPYVYSVEGKNKKCHVHIGTSVNIEKAKKLTTNLLNVCGVDIKNTNILIRTIIKFSSTVEYMNKYGSLVDKNFITYKFDSAYVQSCDIYLSKMRNKQSFIKDFNKVDFLSGVFEYKVKKY